MQTDATEALYFIVHNVQIKWVLIFQQTTAPPQWPVRHSKWHIITFSMTSQKVKMLSNHHFLWDDAILGTDCKTNCLQCQVQCTVLTVNHTMFINLEITISTDALQPVVGIGLFSWNFSNLCAKTFFEYNSLKMVL